MSEAKFDFPGLEAWAVMVHKMVGKSSNEMTAEQRLLSHVVAKAAFDTKREGVQSLRYTREHKAPPRATAIPGFCQILGFNITYLEARVTEALEKTRKVKA